MLCMCVSVYGYIIGIIIIIIIGKILIHVFIYFVI